MKIAVWHNLPSGGGKRALYYHVAGLIQRGHTVECWCPETADATYLPLSELALEHRLPFQPVAAQSRRGWERIAHIGEAEFDPVLAEMDRHSQECAQLILRGGFDALLVAPCRFYSVPRLGRFLAGTNMPILLYLQEPQRWLYEAQPELPWISPSEKGIPAHPFSLQSWRRLRYDYEQLKQTRIAARRELEDAKTYDRILVNSYFSRESVARSYGLDARVCYLGYDSTIFFDRQLPRENFVLGLGSLDYIKGVDTAIEAMARLPSHLRMPFIWVANSGEPTYGKKMEELAASRNVSFEVKRRIADAELVDLLNHAQLLLYTSRLEPFGYAPLEANACATPVVAIAEGGVREVISHRINGLLCDRDWAQLAESMIELLTDRQLARQLGSNGAQIACEKWSLQVATDNLLRHLSHIPAH